MANERLNAFLKKLDEREETTRGGKSLGASAASKNVRVSNNRAAAFLKRIGIDEEYYSPVDEADIEPFRSDVQKLRKSVQNAQLPSQLQRNQTRYDQLEETGGYLEAFANPQDLGMRKDVFQGNYALQNLQKSINKQQEQMGGYKDDMSFVQDNTQSYADYQRYLRAAMGDEYAGLRGEMYTYGMDKTDAAPGMTLEDINSEINALVKEITDAQKPKQPVRDPMSGMVMPTAPVDVSAQEARLKELYGMLENKQYISDEEAETAQKNYFDRFKEDRQAELDAAFAEADRKRLEGFKLQQQAIESEDPAEAARLREEAERMDAEAQMMMDETQMQEDAQQAEYDALKPDRDWGKYIGSGVMQGFSDFANAAYQTYDVVLGKPIDAIVNGAKSVIEKVFGVDTGEDFRNPLSRWADTYKNVNAQYQQEATQAAESMGDSEWWKTGQQVIGGIIQNVPNTVMAFLTGGASAGAAGMQKAARKAMNAVGNSKTVQAVQDMISNPQYWSSFAQTLGNDYNEALEESGDPVKAALYSIGVSLVNAGIEIGASGTSGIQGINQADDGTNIINRAWQAITGRDAGAFGRIIDSATDEAVEELQQGIIGGLAEKVIYDADKPYFSMTDENAIISPELGQQALIGGITGGLLGGGAEVTNAAVGAYQNAEAQREYARAVEQYFSGGLDVAGEAQVEGTTPQTVETPVRSEKQRLNDERAVALTGEETAYEYGLTGRSQEELQNTLEESGIEMTDADRVSFTKGETQRKQNTLARAEYIRKLNRGEGGSRKGVLRSISAEEAKHYGVQEFKGVFSDKQRAAVDALRKVAEMMHINIVHFESPVVDGVRKGANGMYDSASNTVYVDLFAGQGNDQAVMRAAAHELTHVIQEWSPEKYTKLQDMLIKYYYSTGKNTLNEMIQAQKTKAAENGLELTESQALDEVTADACEMMFSDIDAMREIARTDKTLFEKIGEWINKFVDSIKTAMRGIRSSTEESRLLMESKETWENARKIWYQALEEAGQNNPGSVTETAKTVDQTAEIAENTQKAAPELADIVSQAQQRMDGGRMQYSLRSFDDGMRFVDVQANQTEFDGLSEAEMMNKARDIIKQKFQGKVVGIDNTAFVNGAGAREYSRPAVVMRNAETKEAKMRAAGELDNLLDAGVYIGEEEDGRDGHKHKNTDAFTYYRTVFKVGNSYFEGVVNVANVKGRRLFKDVTKIKNITQDITSSYGENPKSRFLRDVSMNSISENGEDVNGNVRFSMREPVETAGSLMAVHNLTEDKLKKTLELGGFPMPSIAITKPEIGHENFGNISLVFGRETVDPAADRRNDVYSADAWTPTFPDVDYEANDKVVSKISKMYYRLAREHGYDEMRPLYDYVNDTERQLKNVGGEQGMMQKLRDDTEMMQIFLADTGKSMVQPVMREKITSMSDGEISISRAVIAEIGEDAIRDMKTPEGTPIITHRKQWYQKNEAGLLKAFEKLLIDNGSTEAEAKEMADYVDRRTLMEMAFNARKYLNGEIEKRTQVEDREATKQAIREATDAAAYGEWLQKMFGGIEKSTGIYNNKELYTSSGNRRSFAQTHYPVTLENIVRAMAGQKGGDTKNVSGFHGIKTLRAGTAKRFASIADMHALEGRLENLTEEQAEAINDQLSERLSNLMGKVLDLNPIGKYDNVFIKMDAIGEVLMEISESGKYDAVNVKKTFAKYQYKLNDETAKGFKELLVDIEQMPVHIFEAKPARVVPFAEVQVAILPDSISPQIKTQLESMGVRTMSYTAGNEAERKEALNSLQDLRFSQRDTEYKTDRQLLASALEGVTKNAEEAQMLREYQEIAAKLDADERRVQEINERIRELRLEDVNTPEEQQLLEERKGLEKGITTADRRLFQMERLQPLQRIAKIQRREAEEALQKARRHLERYKEGVIQREYIGKIKRTSDKLAKWLTKPNNQRYVPEDLRRPLAEFLLAIDRGSETMLAGGGMTQADRDYARVVADLRDVVSNISAYQNDQSESGKVYSMYIDLPRGFVEMMTEHARKMDAKAQEMGGRMTLNRMNAQELEELFMTLTAIASSITHTNDFLSTENAKRVGEVAQDTIGYLREQKPIVTESKIGEFLNWDNLQPVYAFERYGEGGKQIFRMLQDGQSKLAFNTQEIVKEAEKLYTAKEAKQWSEEIKTFTIGGKEVRIPVANIMSLYCLMRRQQGIGHLYGEGIRVGDFKDGVKTVRDDGHNIGDADIARMVGSLTERQKDVAEKLQQVMSTKGSRWGNEISMKRFGYRMFTEKNYFPIEVDRTHLPARTDNGRGNELYRLLNISSTKPITRGANNRIMLNNIFDVFSSHMSDMAQYNAMALPVLDAVKWLNYKESEMEEVPIGEEKEYRQKYTESVRDAARDAYGYAANKYIIGVLRDINGAQMTGGEGYGKMMLGRVNRASVAANLRVAFLQPLSIIRAATVLKGTDILTGAGIGATHIKRNLKEMEEHSGIAVWKQLGFYDVNIGRSVSKLIKHDETKMDKLIDASMKGAEWADRMTWALMWEGAKRDVARTTSPSSEGFLDKVAERFEEVVYKTQVVDSVLTRSQYMRNPGFFAKWTSSFMSEPTTTYNMLLNAYSKFATEARNTNFQKAWKKTGKMVFRTMAVYTVTAAINAIVESLMGAWRDEDDYKTFTEKFQDGYYDNYINNIMPFNKLPLISDVYEYAKKSLALFGVDTYGYGDTNVITQWLDQMYAGLEIIADKASGEPTNYTEYGAIYKLMQGVSSLAGVPAASFMREVVAMWNNTGGRMTGRKIVVYKTSKSQGYQQMYDAIMDENTVRTEQIRTELKENGAEDKNIISGLRSLAKQDYMAGNLTDDEAAAFLQKHCGMSADEAYWKLDEWAWDAEAAAEDYSVYNELEEALLTGTGIDAAVKRLTDHGYEKSKVQSKVRELVKAGYIAGDLTQTKVTSLLKVHGGLTDNEAYFKQQQYEYERLTGDSTSSDACMIFYEIDNKRSPAKAIDAALKHGKTKSGLASSLTSRYKEQYLELLKTNKSAAYQLATRLAGIFDYLGYEGTKKVQGWTETK